MKLNIGSSLLLAASLFGIAVADLHQDASHQSLLDVATIGVQQFNSWMQLHNKRYETDGEVGHRLSVYLKNADVVAKHNQAYKRGYTTYAMSLDGPFADMTADEFDQQHLMEWQDCSATTHESSGSIDDLKLHRGWEAELWKKPWEVDWRTKGVVAPIKNQEHCGSCWTFSTTGCLESHTCLQRRREGSTIDFDCTSWTGLAEQQLLDCSRNYNNNGCNGGLPSQAFVYIHDAGGIDTEASYPYEGQDESSCRYSPTTKGSEVAEGFNITSGAEDDLVQAVAEIGPVSVAYQVSPDFRLYQHGIYDSFNATTNATMCHNESHDVNHAVVAVGLGTTADGRDYYIVRNSWSKSWGMEGYFWMLRGENLCGVSDCASFPIVPTTDAVSSIAAGKESMEATGYLRQSVN